MDMDGNRMGQIKTTWTNHIHIYIYTWYHADSITPLKSDSPSWASQPPTTKGLFMFIHDPFQIIEQILGHLGPFEGLSAGVLEVYPIHVCMYILDASD